MAANRRRDPPRPTPPLADPAETVQRLVPRRHLLIQDGDIIIARVSAGLLSATFTRNVYELRIRGRGPTGDRFANFEHAAAAGEQLARLRKVRLFYLEDADEAPHLLKDNRR